MKLLTLNWDEEWFLPFLNSYVLLIRKRVADDLVKIRKADVLKEYTNLRIEGKNFQYKCIVISKILSEKLCT